MIKLWRFLSVSIVVAVCLGLLLVPGMGVSAGEPGAGKATFLLPAEVRVSPGETFSVNVTIYNPHNIDIYTAAMDLVWSPGLLNVTAIDNLAWPSWLACDWDNATGEAWYAGGGTMMPGGILCLNETNIVHCQVHFVAGSAEGTVTVNFTPLTENGETTLLDIDSVDICNWTAGDMQNMTVKIGTPKLTVNVTPAGKGDVEINGTIPSVYPDTTTWSWDEVVNLEAVNPAPGWTFDHWSGDLSNNATPTNITMDGDKSVTANFYQLLPTIPVSPDNLTFNAIEGGENPPDQTLEVCNTGNGTLNWEMSDDAGWLSEAPTSGSLGEDNCEDVTVSVDVTGMEAGDYSATITTTGSLEVKVVVNLHIESAVPVEPAQWSPSGLSISPQQVEPGEEVTISINVTNTGGKTGSYNAILYINSEVEDSQSVSVAPGMTRNVIFTVSKSQSGVYDVLLAGQSGQFEVVSTGWFGGGLSTGGIVAIVVIVIVLIVVLVFVLRRARRAL